MFLNRDGSIPFFSDRVVFRTPILKPNNVYGSNPGHHGPFYFIRLVYGMLLAAKSSCTHQWHEFALWGLSARRIELLTCKSFSVHLLHGSALVNIFLCTQRMAH